MAATETIVGSLHQSSSAMGSSAILSFKPLHPGYEFRRSCRKFTPCVQASAAGKEDHSTATLRKSCEESSSRSSSVSSLLKAVQVNGSSAVLQQMSSIRHFFMPELPQSIIREIKKRMALPFKEQDDEENALQDDDLNGGLLKDFEEEQVTLLGPRCTWPRMKLMSAEGERQEEVIGGPRCVWPRAAQTHSSSSSLQQGKQEENTSSTIGEGASGAKCAWPRVSASRNYNQDNTNKSQKGFMYSSRSAIEGFQKVGISKSPQEGLLDPMRSLEGLQNGATLKGTQGEGLEKEALSKSVQEGKEEAFVNNSVIEGPRCAWPRSTPRRMLATGVGLSLMNYLFIGQTSPALAILLETPLPITCEEDLSLSSPIKSLLP